jgi:hypothetical protein
MVTCYGAVPSPKMESLGTGADNCCHMEPQIAVQYCTVQYSTLSYNLRHKIGILFISFNFEFILKGKVIEPETCGRSSCYIPPFVLDSLTN